MSHDSMWKAETLTRARDLEFSLNQLRLTQIEWSIDSGHKYTAFWSRYLCKYVQHEWFCTSMYVSYLQWEGINLPYSRKQTHNGSYMHMYEANVNTFMFSRTHRHTNLKPPLGKLEIRKEYQHYKIRKEPINSFADLLTMTIYSFFLVRTFISAWQLWTNLTCQMIKMDYVIFSIYFYWF